MVVPAILGEPFRDKADVLAVCADPLPLVADVICAADDYDLDSKVKDYRKRGNLEIWLLHTAARTLTTWVRQQDGSYFESVYRDGSVSLSALAGVEIDLDRLFADEIPTPDTESGCTLPFAPLGVPGAAEGPQSPYLP